MKISISGIIGWDVTAESVEKMLPSNGEPLEIAVNSEGGEVFEAFAIYNAIKNYKGETTVIVDAMAASAAAYIIFAADRIKVYPNSVIMVHCAWTCACGNAPELRSCADLLAGLDNVLCADYAAAAAITKEEALARMEKEVWLIGSEAIIAHGLKKVEKIDYEKKESVQELNEPQARAKFALVREKIKGRQFDALKAKKMLAQVIAPRSKSMDIKELLAALEENPELKAGLIEHLTPQEPAGDGGGEPPAAPKPADAAAEAASRRVSQILALAGGTMTPHAKTAIENGMSVLDFMVEQTVRDRQASANLDRLGNPSAKQPIALGGGGNTESKDGPVTDDEKLRAMARRK